MKKSRFTETQIIAALKEYAAGKTSSDICRELGINKNTLLNWKKKYSGMEVQQLRELKNLQEENRRLKAMYADLSLEHRILKDVVEKKL
jgi:putative transposase